MITFTDAIDQLHTKANSKKAAEMKNSIKIDRGLSWNIQPRT